MILRLIIPTGAELPGGHIPSNGHARIFVDCRLFWRYGLQEPPSAHKSITLILEDEHGDPTFGCDERVVTGKGGRQAPLVLLFIIVIQI